MGTEQVRIRTAYGHPYTVTRKSPVYFIHALFRSAHCARPTGLELARGARAKRAEVHGT